MFVFSDGPAIVRYLLERCHKKSTKRTYYDTIRPDDDGRWDVTCYIPPTDCFVNQRTHNNCKLQPRTTPRQ